MAARRLFKPDTYWTPEALRLRKILDRVLTEWMTNYVEADGEVDIRDLHFVMTEVVSDLISMALISARADEVRNGG